jgi:hypothetical protein
MPKSGELVLELVRDAAEADLAHVDDMVAVSDGQRRAQILLYQEDGEDLGRGRPIPASGRPEWRRRRNIRARPCGTATFCAELKPAVEGEAAWCMILRFRLRHLGGARTHERGGPGRL